jgi:hypothetical protein
MKNTSIRNLSGLTLLGVMLFATNITRAQTAAPSATSTATTSTTTSAGTVSQFSPDTIVVRTTTAADPVSYSYTKTTSYVDEDGNAVSSETVKSGAPVTIYYTQDGDNMVATKVVVRKTTTSTSDATSAPVVETKKTTTTTTTP